MSATNALTVQEAPWGSAQVALIKETVCKGASDLELNFFLNVARRTGLDPIARQIYSVPRSGGRVIQVAIDGYRLIAQRTGEYAGNDEPIFDTEEGEHPNIARVTVWRLVDGEPRSFTGIARWQEFKPPDGQDVMWRKMPWHMLAMAAERQALRKAFPQELAGLETSEDPPTETTPAREIRPAAVPVHPAQGAPARPPVGGSSRAQLRATVAQATRPSPTPAKHAVEESPAGPDEDDAVLRDELRELGTRGFDLNQFLTRRNKELDELTRDELEGILPIAHEVVQKRVERLTKQA